jgi:GT2 family glycosyltransferase/glycosyltransferase involved in cell wall biosynthesis
VVFVGDARRKIVMLRELYHRLPLPPSWKRWLQQQRRRWQAGPAAAGWHEARTSTDLGPAAKPGIRDWVFFGVIDWHFRHQRPQQLALALARQTGGRVFYLTPHLLPQADVGYAVECIDGAAAVYQIALHAATIPNIYEHIPDVQALAQLRAGLAQLWQNAGIDSAVCVVQHPFWLELARGFGDALLVYDCMDHHAGFDNTAPAHEARELELLAQSDLTIVTSDFLEAWARPHARAVAMVRNAADDAHFRQAARPETMALPPKPRPIVGYYGAIAGWFDVALVDALAGRFPDVDWVLVGDDTAGARRALAHHAHVRLPGEVRYAELPRWLATFDVCLIPFQRTPLTMATNPVKVYEYLSAGKPVVATDLPELSPLAAEGLVALARDVDGFERAIRAALAESADKRQAAEAAARRMAYAQQQTWDARARTLQAALQALPEPSVSVVVVCYNQWRLTQRCLESLEACADGVPLQVIAVDNASRDETAEGLARWQAQDPERRRAIIQAENLGFAGGVNAGMAHATGDYLVVLNNDTIVTPGWARGLRRHFEREPQLGLLCPVTNNIGNEARVELPGDGPEAVLAAARAYTRVHAGQWMRLQTAAFFCVMLPRRVWAQIGPMDERFFPGFFEDDDYCRRLQAAGYEIGCAEDVFVYHELSASFDQEGARRKQEIFERNRRLYEEKWGHWEPHRYRASTAEVLESSE